MRSHPANADRLVIVISDVEMGPGGVLDDFPHSEFLAELITRYNRGPSAGLAIDLVFDGDTFDFLKTSVDGRYPRHITPQLALAKLDRILAAHGAFFEGVRAFLTGASAPRAVHFIVGNHDAELVFPAVQQRIAAQIGAAGVHFPGFELDIGDLHIEHGNQRDPMFAVDPARPIVLWRGQEILDLPWASVALIDVVLPLQPLLYALDRVKPRHRVFELLPEVRELLSNAFWRYWTREYLYDLVARTDPMRKVSWTMVKEVMYRFSTFDPDTAGGAAYHGLVQRDDRFRVVVVGHHHQPAWWTWGDRKLLQTGCFRNEYILDRQGAIGGLLPKVYAEVYLERGRAIRSHLVEVDGPAPPPDHVPDSLLELRPRVLPLLAPAEERAELDRAQKAQADLEARGD